MHFDIDISAPAWFYVFAIIGAVTVAHATYILIRDGITTIRNLFTKSKSVD